MRPLVALLLALPPAALLPACGAAEARTVPDSVAAWAGTWEADLGPDVDASEVRYVEHWRLDGVRVVQSISPAGEVRAVGTWELLAREGDDLDLRLTLSQGVVSDDAATALRRGEDHLELTVSGDTVPLHRTFRPVVLAP